MAEKKRKVLVLSDTHNLLRPQVKEMLADCDAVIHSGDFATQKVADELRDAAGTDIPIFMVRGNNDGEWASQMPEHLEFELYGVSFYVVHDKKDLPECLGDCRVIIFGHSHRYLEEYRDGRLYLNPGSCGKRRFNLDITLAVLYLENGRISVERVEISGIKKKEYKELNGRQDLPKVIGSIIKRMDKGQRIEKICRELNIERDFAEEVCRIRVTHPGVGAEGILNKMEVNKKQAAGRIR